QPSSPAPRPPSRGSVSFGVLVKDSLPPPDRLGAIDCRQRRQVVSRPSLSSGPKGDPGLPRVRTWPASATRRCRSPSAILPDNLLDAGGCRRSKGRPEVSVSADEAGGHPFRLAD